MEIKTTLSFGCVTNTNHIDIVPVMPYVHAIFDNFQPNEELDGFIIPNTDVSRIGPYGEPECLADSSGAELGLSGYYDTRISFVIHAENAAVWLQSVQPNQYFIVLQRPVKRKWRTVCKYQALSMRSRPTNIYHDNLAPIDITSLEPAYVGNDYILYRLPYTVRDILMAFTMFNGHTTKCFSDAFAYTWLSHYYEDVFFNVRLKTTPLSVHIVKNKYGVRKFTRPVMSPFRLALVRGFAINREDDNPDTWHLVHLYFSNFCEFKAAAMLHGKSDSVGSYYDFTLRFSARVGGGKAFYRCPTTKA